MGYFLYVCFQDQRNIAEISQWRGGMAEEMEGESKQRKGLVLKKVENISRAWCSIEHAEWTVL